MTRALRAGAILAAGEGSRLKQEGWTMPKPLVPVAGVALLEHVLSNFAAAGITSVSIVFNEDDKACAEFARRRFPDLDLRIAIKTTPSSLATLQTVVPLLPEGPVLVSTVDAWCPRGGFLSFVEAAASAGPDETVLAVTPFVDDERPLWASVDDGGRVIALGGDSGQAVTAGMYVFSDRARRLAVEARLSRLREFLAWLVRSGEPVRAVSIPKVVDVDRAADVAQAEHLGESEVVPDAERLGESEVPSPKSAVVPDTCQPSTFNRQPVARCWGIYRELAHSPGRESDDAQILRATAERLAGRGFDVELKSPEEILRTDSDTAPAPFLFVMCERAPVVQRLAAWERNGARIVNRPEAIRNTDRERTIARFSGDGVPFPTSVVVSTGAALPLPVTLPCWIKRGDVHATAAEDVTFAARPEELAARLSALSARSIGTAVVQEHVPGDLIKFYGVAGAGENGKPLSWFEWFYHRDQELSKHPFDPDELRRAVARGAAALGLEVFGGDAIATASGRIVLIDVNAWPSFALYREVAAERIATHLAQRFGLSTLDSGRTPGTQ